MGTPAATPLAEAAKDTPAIPKALPKGPPFEARFARAMAVSSLGPPHDAIILARWPPFVNRVATA